MKSYSKENQVIQTFLVAFKFCLLRPIKHWWFGGSLVIDSKRDMSSNKSSTVCYTSSSYLHIRFSCFSEFAGLLHNPLINSQSKYLTCQFWGVFYLWSAVIIDFWKSKYIISPIFPKFVIQCSLRFLSGSSIRLLSLIVLPIKLTEDGNIIYGWPESWGALPSSIVPRYRIAGLKGLPPFVASDGMSRFRAIICQEHQLEQEPVFLLEHRMYQTVDHHQEDLSEN